MSIDLTKPVQTRNGHKVRILCTDARDAEGEPVHGLYECDGYEVYGAWTSAGRWSHAEEHSMDLINVPPPKKKVKVDVRLWEDHDGIIRSASNAIHSGKEWGNDLSVTWLASTTIEMEYQP